MKTGFRGTFVIPWSQTEVDGVPSAPVAALSVGSTWRRVGDAVRLDGPDKLLLLSGAEGGADLRKRAAKSVHRLVGTALDGRKSLDGADADDPLMDRGFVVTDGRHSYTATEIFTVPGKPPLLMFVDELPPAHIDLWVVRQISETPPITQHLDTPEGVICFAKGTMIDTPNGRKAVEELQEGDRIQTKDDGAQEILWRGSRRMSGARLYAIPSLRPVRIRAGAFGGDMPEPDLIVSPEHRVLIKGRAAMALFSTPEVLVSARDLINDNSVLVDHSLREVTYVHLMLPRHQVVWANGVETESFHPAHTSLSALDAEDRIRLLRTCPHVADDPYAYGEAARRNLTRSEAAILQHEAPLRH